MMRRTSFGLLLMVAGFSVMVSLIAQSSAEGEGIDLRGVVQSAEGPEAGVWVIAETDALDTRFRKIVVSDDAGRFVVPDLPRPTRYGYGDLGWWIRSLLWQTLARPFR